MRLSGEFRKTRPFSLTSLIDVIFLLLVFFMLSSTFLRYTSFTLQGGQSGGASVEIRDTVLVRIHADGKLDLNGQSVELARLNAKINELSKGQRLLSPANAPQTPHIMIKPVGGASVQHLVTVIEQLKQSGNMNLMIVN